MEIKRKYVSVHYNGSLPEFGNIQGPILNPVWIDIDIIWKLLVNGRIVYEHCITDPDKRLKLNKENYDDFNMYPENSEIEDPSIDPNTYLLTIKDAPTKDRDMATGNLYVEIL